MYRWILIRLGNNHVLNAINKMKSYIKYPNSKAEKAIWIEVEWLENVKTYGQKRCRIKPVSGEGELVIQADKVIIK